MSTFCQIKVILMSACCQSVNWKMVANNKQKEVDSNCCFGLTVCHILFISHILFPGIVHLEITVPVGWAINTNN